MNAVNLCRTNDNKEFCATSHIRTMEYQQDADADRLKRTNNTEDTSDNQNRIKENAENSARNDRVSECVEQRTRSLSAEELLNCKELQPQRFVDVDNHGNDEHAKLKSGVVPDAAWQRRSFQSPTESKHKQELETSSDKRGCTDLKVDSTNESECVLTYESFPLQTGYDISENARTWPGTRTPVTQLDRRPRRKIQEHGTPKTTNIIGNIMSIIFKNKLSVMKEGRSFKRSVSESESTSYLRLFSTLSEQNLKHEASVPVDSQYVEGQVRKYKANSRKPQTFADKKEFPKSSKSSKSTTKPPRTVISKINDADDSARPGETDTRTGHTVNTTTEDDTVSTPTSSDMDTPPENPDRDRPVRRHDTSRPRRSHDVREPPRNHGSDKPTKNYRTELLRTNNTIKPSITDDKHGQEGKPSNNKTWSEETKTEAFETVTNREVGGLGRPSSDHQRRFGRSLAKVDSSREVQHHRLVQHTPVLQDCYFSIKLILLGDYGVGKAHLLHALTKAAALDPGRNVFRCTTYKPREFVELVTVREGKKILVKIVSTAGQERFRSVTSSYFRGAHGCLLVFNITQENSFDHIMDWYCDMQRYTNINNKLLLGITTPSQTRDLREVTTGRAFKLAEGLQTRYMETAMDDQEMLLWIVKQMADTASEQFMSSPPSLDVVTISPTACSKAKKKRRKFPFCAS